MTGRIYLLQEDGTLQSLTERPYANEGLLQALLVDYPDLLAGDQFEALADRRGSEATRVARAILDWIRPQVTDVWWGRGSRRGSFVPALNHNGTDHQLFAVWTYGTFEVYFQYYQYKPPFDSEEKRRELLSQLNAIEGISM